MTIKYCVYKHTAPSGKSYIGLTKDYRRRCSSHKSKGSKCIAFVNAINKYGWDNIKSKILIENITLEEAQYWEKYYIAELSTLAPNGFNLKCGGEGGGTPSDDTKKLLREKTIKRFEDKQEREAAREKTLLFMKTSPEQWAENQEKAKLAKKSDAARQKTSAAQKKRFEDAEQIEAARVRANQQMNAVGMREKISTGLKKYYSENPEIRTAISEQMKEFYRDTDNRTKKLEAHQHQKKSYRVTYQDGSEVIIKGLKEFCRANNLNAGSVNRVIRGEAKHTKKIIIKMHDATTWGVVS